MQPSKDRTLVFEKGLNVLPKILMALAILSQAQAAFAARSCPSIFHATEPSYFVENYKQIHGEIQNGVPTCWLHATVKMLEAFSRSRTGQYRQISVEHLYLANLVDRIQEGSVRSRRDLFSQGTILHALVSSRNHGIALKSEHHDPGAFFNPARYTDRVWSRLSEVRGTKSQSTPYGWMLPLMTNPFLTSGNTGTTNNANAASEESLYLATELVWKQQDASAIKQRSLETADQLLGDYHIEAVLVVGVAPSPMTQKRLSMGLPIEFHFVRTHQEALSLLKNRILDNQMPALTVRQGRGTHSVNAVGYHSDPSTGQIETLTVLDSDNQRQNWHGKKHRKMGADELRGLAYFISLKETQPAD